MNNSMVKKHLGATKRPLYPNLFYNVVCYQETALYEFLTLYCLSQCGLFVFKPDVIMSHYFSLASWWFRQPTMVYHGSFKEEI